MKLNKARKVPKVDEEILLSMFERGKNDSNQQNELIMKLTKPESDKDSPYSTNHITIAESQKRMSDARLFNELQKKKLQEKRDVVQGELAEIGDYAKMFAEDERIEEAKAAELERLSAVYPEPMFGPEMNKIYSNKFITMSRPRPKPSVRKAPNTRKANPRPKPSVRRQPRNSKTPTPVTRKINPTVPTAPTMKPKPVPRGRRRS